MQVPLSDEAIAVRVAELVDGLIKQLLSVWDKLEPALGGAAMPTDVSSASLSISSNGHGELCTQSAMYGVYLVAQAECHDKPS